MNTHLRVNNIYQIIEIEGNKRLFKKKIIKKFPQYNNNYENRGKMQFEEVNL